jgi:hypothetical protein
MTDLHSVVAFFQKAKWTGIAIAHETNRVPGENTIGHSTVGNVFGCLFYQRKKQTRRSSRIGSDFSLDDRITFVLSEGLFLSVRQTAKKVMTSKSIV